MFWLTNGEGQHVTFVSAFCGCRFESSEFAPEKCAKASERERLRHTSLSHQGSRHLKRGRKVKIYLAGPLFTTAEREFNTKLAGLLRERARALAATKHRTAQEHNPH